MLNAAWVERYARLFSYTTPPSCPSNGHRSEKQQAVPSNICGVHQQVFAMRQQNNEIPIKIHGVHAWQPNSFQTILCYSHSLQLTTLLIADIQSVQAVVEKVCAKQIAVRHEVIVHVPNNITESCRIRVGRVSLSQQPVGTIEAG